MRTHRPINFSRGVPILNEEDLRDCFAMFALAGAVMAGKSRTAEEVWQIADEMMEARKPKDEAGIASVKRTRKTK
jgi:mannose/cellobiose epimerase-like protein (N-acyl-D-glucosamine 2-epimerase family)